MVKILSSNSERKQVTPAAESFSLISDEKLLAIYAAMLKCRLLERGAATLFQEGELGSDLRASAGREATAAAVGVDVQAGDTLSLPQGDWLTAFVKGMSIESIFRALASSSTPTNKVRKNLETLAQQKNIFFGSDDALRAASALKSAIEAKADKKGSIVVVLLPRELQAIKAWKAVLTAASAEKLPIVFVHPIAVKNSAKAKVNPEALFHTVPGIVVDGTDPVAVYRVAFEAIVRARQGRGATLLQCSDDSESVPCVGVEGNGQSPDALPSLDPIFAMEIYLRRKRIEPEQYRREIVAQFGRDFDLATRFLANEVKDTYRIGSAT